MVAKVSEVVEIDHLPELVSLAEEVERTGAPRILTHQGRQIAVLTPPVSRKRSRKPTTTPAKAGNPNAWLEGLIGIGSSAQPSDISKNKKRYIADAIHAESHPRTDE